MCCHGNCILWAKNWGKSCVANYFFSFWPISHGIRHRCLPWGVDVQDTVFDKWQKVCCHGNHILWAKNGGKSCVANCFSVFDRFSWNSAQMFALGCRCARHSFWQWQIVCCHGNHILWAKNGGQSCVANYFLSFWPILMEFGTDVCLWV